MDREIRFGLINLVTNGFDREIYERLFDQDNLPAGSEHPRNWSVGKLQELLRLTGMPLDDLTGPQIEAVIRSGATRISKDGIERIHSAVASDQARIDSIAGYEESQGFFRDLLNVYGYCQDQVRIGLNAYSGRVHSDLFIRGEGSTAIVSEGGISYKLSPWIWIEGQKHYWEFYLHLNWPTEEGDDKARSKIRDFLMSHEWLDGLRLVPEYWEVSRGGGEMKKEVFQHNVESPGLGVYAVVRPAAAFSICVNTPIVGEVRNLESFCRTFVNQLDLYFVP